jgi:fatty acid desaturase
VFALFFAFGHPWLYLFLWLLPWATMFRVFNRLRALAEHGGMTRSDDRRLTSHNIKQGFMAKHLFLSQGIGYHLAHHVDSGIPMANLAKLHRALEEDGYISESFSYPGYWNFIGKLWRKDG